MIKYSKNSKMVVAKSKDEDIIKTFINLFIHADNNIISDSWVSYDWLEEENSGYSHLKY